MVVDHHLYKGERPSPIERGNRGVRHLPEVGGAKGLRLLLDALATEARRKYDEACAAAAKQAADAAMAAGKSKEDVEAAAAEAARHPSPPLREPIACKAYLGVEPPDCHAPQAVHHAFAIWQPYPLDRDKPDKEKVWRTNLKMGYGHEPISADPNALFTPRRREFAGTPDLLVLDDAGFLFRNSDYAACWHLPQAAANAPWMLLKLSDPIAQGDLWRTLVPAKNGAPSHADRMVCLVSVDDLRNEDVRITPGVSWEKTLEDLSDELRSPTLAPLARCRHLVVVIGGEAVLWIDRESERKAAHFCFVPSAAEGDFAAGFEGESIGYLTAMASALAYGMSQTLPGKELDLAPWMEAGLRAMRDLLRQGHGLVVEGPQGPRGYPVDRLARVILAAGSGDLAQGVIAWPPQPRCGRPWMIVEASQRPLDTTEVPTLVGLAGEVVRHGSAAYGRLPHAIFGKFITAERAEIEMLRGIRRLMLAYKRAAKTSEKPLAVGVFGPPGAGKSFAVREIAMDIFGKEAWLEFNLSQFANHVDLNGALHRVRDKVLDGQIPVVFWDEFDARGFHWLQYLLAPLQDGRFQDGALSHTVGRSVFVFAGGTSRCWVDFGRHRNQEEEAQSKLLKVPDFKSRLDAFYDVSGPNPRWQVDGKGDPVMCGDEPCADATDIGYTMRRALLIRGQLGLDPKAVLDVDADLLRALLLVPQYRHGARSLEKVVKALAATRGAPVGSSTPPSPVVLRRSDLPPPALLGISVDATQFDKLLDGGRAFIEDRLAEEMAPKFHEGYRNTARAKGWYIQPHIDQPFEKLDAALREDNIAAARRLPSVLALAGLGIEPVNATQKSAAPDSKTLEAHLRHNLERLAEAEHDGWWDFRRRNGWTHGTPRDDANRIHPLMVPYEKLSEAAKDLDRDTVLKYGDRLAEAGYRVVWL
ncbi:MAG: RyR domain-containing protein [Acetobacteraceae bacterium]